VRSSLLLAFVVALLGACRSRPVAPADAARPHAVNTGDLPVASDAAADSLLVDLRSLDSTIVVELRYATTNNFTGAPLPGYEANRAFLRREAAAAFARAERRAVASGLRLKVWDGYRPVRATDAMVAWTERTGRGDLLRDGYIASRSRHNLGLAVDCTLVDAATGAELTMGTPFDTFSADAHTANATGQAAANRQRLRAILESEGFANYDQEWWHIAFPVPNPVRFDRVIRE
jgi:D-alanyl-D-alanine dipeptidase